MFILNLNKMHTLLFSITAFAFFMLYNTSQKVKYEKKCTLTTWIRSNTKLSKIIAYSLLIIALTTESIYEGLGVGSLTFFIFLMFIGSAILTLYPMLSFKTKHIVSFIGLGLFLELLIF
ncbi:hypothetical protein HX045_07725 [Myroides odoratimimus]|uniref:Uncharacterized protein n=2 Tax=Myroides odoratimimus TaxID=76832 RepID=A0A0U3H9F8_9FLAO|nr:hypothetical protein MYRA21_0021 [Myroides sp. A21]ALU27516.1 hypothetical protein AS202_15805 [Myroides odoratimimus]APA90683.1 hypothetical protein BK054_00100 [Myroides sp. ZB35]EHO07591.1 hypothetical protein HMPREF9714_02671 [Myroides odoratimimus CCUG 12901]EHO09501.1 hypothetical protein HMPREF9712_01810 [Myroides odoratimimus CCUG 10230]EKB05256.1 hypothetical protein HMPREF9711_01391 [Myroides odoratimimus CCUG 3837]EPH14000.1 hypothetical protein HMPREF9713_00200 [Myroides odorat